MAASMALSQASASFSLSTRHNVCAFSSPKFTSYCPFPRSNAFNRSTSFTSGSPLLIQKSSARQHTRKAIPVSIRSEQSTQGGSGLDVWLGRAAMVGFAVAITVEITTGKGLLENFGLTSPLPTVALAVTTLVGVLTAIFIFQSASKT